MHALIVDFAYHEWARYRWTPYCLCELLEQLLALSLTFHALLTQVGSTVLHLAARTNQTNFVDYLLSICQFSVDIIDRYGRTPLWCAADNGYVDSVGVLLEYGANPFLIR